MESRDKKIGEKVRQARAIKGLSQKELGKYLNLNKQGIYSIEKGIRRLSASELDIVAEITNKPLSFFYEEEPQIKEKVEAFNENYLDLSGIDDNGIEALRQMADLLRDKNKKNSSEENIT